MVTNVKTKKWGNSIGVIIPNDIVESMHIRPNEELVIEVKKKHNVLKELFGSLDFNGKSTKELLEESREDLNSKWMD